MVRQSFITTQESLVTAILGSLRDQIIPKWVDYNITIHQYGDLIDQLVADGLIEGANVKRAGRNHKTIMVFLEGTRLTAKGLKYLNDIKSK